MIPTSGETLDSFLFKSFLLAAYVNKIVQDKNLVYACCLNSAILSLLKSLLGAPFAYVPVGRRHILKCRRTALK